MSINQITSDLHRALKQQDKLKVETLRYLLAEIKKYQIDHYPPDSKKNITREEIWQTVVEYLSDKISADYEVGVNIVGDRKMKQLNNQYRKIDQTCSVLA